MCGFACFTHAAAIEVAADGAALEPHLGEVGGSIIYLSEGRAAVNVARDRAAIDGNEDIAARSRSVTFSSAEHVLTDRAAQQVHCNVVCDGAYSVAAAIDIHSHFTTGYIDFRAGDPGTVAATEDVAYVAVGMTEIHSGFAGHSSKIAAAEHIVCDIGSWSIRNSVTCGKRH